MEDDEIKIVGKDNKVITLKELFEGKKTTRKELAKIYFQRPLT